jgi:hypothetical protein
MGSGKEKANYSYFSSNIVMSSKPFLAVPEQKRKKRREKRARSLDKVGGLGKESSGENDNGRGEGNNNSSGGNNSGTNSRKHPSALTAEGLVSRKSSHACQNSALVADSVYSRFRDLSSRSSSGDRLLSSVSISSDASNRSRSDRRMSHASATVARGASASSPAAIPNNLSSNGGNDNKQDNGKATLQNSGNRSNMSTPNRRESTLLLQPSIFSTGKTLRAPGDNNGNNLNVLTPSSDDRRSPSNYSDRSKNSENLSLVSQAGSELWRQGNGNNNATTGPAAAVDKHAAADEGLAAAAQDDDAKRIIDPDTGKTGDEPALGSPASVSSPSGVLEEKQTTRSANSNVKEVDTVSGGHQVHHYLSRT